MPYRKVCKRRKKIHSTRDSTQLVFKLNNHFILCVIQQLSKWKHNEILKAIAEWSLYTMDFWFSSLT